MIKYRVNLSLDSFSLVAASFCLFIKMSLYERTDFFQFCLFLGGNVSFFCHRQEQSTVCNDAALHVYMCV